MPRKLGRISDEDAALDIADLTESLPIRLARDVTDAPAEARWRHSGILARMYVKLALARYQLDAPDSEVVSALRAAAMWKAATVRAGFQGGEVWSLLLHDLGVVTAFGADADRQAFGALPAGFAVGTADDDVAGPALAAAWIAYLRDGTLDRAALAGVVVRCERDGADRWDRLWAHGLASCLVAAAGGDAAGFARGLESVARFTQHQASRGDWRVQPEGQLSLPALGVCQVGRELGLRPTSDSPHIPTALLGGQARTPRA